jgi:hypothetical protein
MKVAHSHAPGLIRIPLDELMETAFSALGQQSA